MFLFISREVRDFLWWNVAFCCKFVMKSFLNTIYIDPLRRLIKAWIKLMYARIRVCRTVDERNEQTGVQDHVHTQTYTSFEFDS